MHFDVGLPEQAQPAGGDQSLIKYVQGTLDNVKPVTMQQFVQLLRGIDRDAYFFYHAIHLEVLERSI